MGFESLFGFGTQAPPGGSVSHQSFFERMGNAIVGVFIGIALFLGGLGVIGWNEGRAVHTSCAIFEAAEMVQAATCEKSQGFDNKLIYVACPIDKQASVQIFSFPDLGIQTDGIVFQGTLEQYQSVEAKSCTSKKDSVGGGTTEVCTYSYDSKWSSSAASPFQSPDRAAIPSYIGENPPFPSITGLPFVQKSAQVVMGKGYTLSEDMISSAAGASSPAPANLAPFVDGNTFNPKFPGQGGAPNEIINVAGGGSNFRQLGDSLVTYPSQPRIGDLRIGVTVAGPVDSFGVMAKQLPAGNFAKQEFEKCSGYSFYQYQAGTPTQDDLINKAKGENDTMTFVIRAICFFMLWCGLQLCLGPCMLVPDLIPCIGPYISDLVGCLLCAATCLVATFWFCLVVAISWIYFRPIIGIPLFIVAVISGTALIYWRVKAKNDKQRRASQSDEGTGNYHPVQTPVPVGGGQPNPGGGYPAPGGGYPPPGGGYPPPQQGYSYPPPQ